MSGLKDAIVSLQVPLWSGLKYLNIYRIFWFPDNITNDFGDSKTFPFSTTLRLTFMVLKFLTDYNLVQADTPYIDGLFNHVVITFYPVPSSA